MKNEEFRQRYRETASYLLSWSKIFFKFQVTLPVHAHISNTPWVELLVPHFVNFFVELLKCVVQLGTEVYQHLIHQELFLIGEVLETYSVLENVNKQLIIFLKRIIQTYVPQCENFKIFVSLRFYVKSLFGVLKVQNLPF